VAVELDGNDTERDRTIAQPDNLPANSAKDPVFESSLNQFANQWFVRATIIVITCSFVSGALEGAAFRILAPLVGVSMFLSAGVVGVVLTGMAIGNAIGGVIAARYGTVAALKNSLATAAISTLSIVIIWTIALKVGFYDGWPMIPKVVVWSFSLFLVPALALGTITPQVIGLSVRDVRRTGSITGHLYGYSTLGCICGIMVSAWFMIENLGAIRTSILCGVLPLLMILLLGRFEAVAKRRESLRLAAGLLVFGVCLFLHHQSPFDRESKYFALKVTDAKVDNRELKKLALDSLIHSSIDLKDPSFLFYAHEQIQADLTRAAAVRAREAGRTPRILVIGGGGYSYPRWVEAQADLADVQIEVVEIDPAVTEIAHDKLGLSRSTRIISIHKDGRQFVKTAPAATYDLVIQDAVNDMSVPYHLMTAEYEGLVKRLLHPNCLYLLTVIDNFDSGRFLASAVRTTETVFGNVNLMLPGKPAADTRNVFVIAGRNSTEAADTKEFFTEVERQNVRASTYVFPTADIKGLLSRCEQTSPLLTDDFAPVDVLMSSQFVRRENPEM
ncbi:MAG: fused MFS/spermidine synthase, partial [Pirellulaceae bacterium]|nr:fused MFS/spermidine synthase [Pirellulaceae bacterium]